MKVHWMDGLTLLFLGAALLQLLFFSASGGNIRQPFALLQSQDPPQALQGPGSLDRALQSRLGTVGEVFTIEDLVRGSLALQKGELKGVTPLSSEEQKKLATLVQQAQTHRDALLKIEGELSQSEQNLAEEARQIAMTLTPEQRVLIQQRRDQVSVGEIEKSYWDALLATLPAAP
jgi:hypothetical protein